MPSAFVAGCAGLSFSDAERRFFRDAGPCGFILFQRNCETPEQVRRLTDEFREAAGTDRTLVLVDQEGGRVQRMAPPQWRELPAAQAFADLYREDPERATDTARAVARLCAHDLKRAGINMNCVPVLDVPAPDGHEIIGTRAYGSDVATIVALGRAVAEGHLAGGVSPVIKHLPGHGRATVDSHLSLPRVNAGLADLETIDFAPFRQLNTLPAGMTGHVVYEALDAHECASTSATVIGETIRGHIGFDGLLMSDDLSMKALDGDMRDRTARVLAAGCDVALHCNGDMAEMEAVASVAPELNGASKARYAAVFGAIANAQPLDITAAEAALKDVFTMAAV
ncbi:MAG: beta-N-acetylhexosaminidase [Hyphomicrobiaceae bacterium]